MEVSGQPHTPAALPPGKEPSGHIRSEAEWTPELVWTTWIGEKSCPYRDSYSDPSAAQLVSRRYTDCVILALSMCIITFELIFSCSVRRAYVSKKLRLTEALLTEHQTICFLLSNHFQWDCPLIAYNRLPVAGNLWRSASYTVQHTNMLVHNGGYRYF
jgi:hypothetical protein